MRTAQPTKPNWSPDGLGIGECAAAAAALRIVIFHLPGSYLDLLALVDELVK